MALETDKQEPREGKKVGRILQRHDSLYGDAEKVPGARNHGSEVSFSTPYFGL